MMTKNNTLLPVDTLEIVGVGSGVETLESANLWEAVEQSNGAYIISQKQEDCPPNFQRARMGNAKRNDATITSAMRHFMDSYPLPMAVVGPFSCIPDINTEGDAQRYANACNFIKAQDPHSYSKVSTLADLPTQRGQVLNSYLNDDPDKLWNFLFTTFDEHQDLPAMGVAVNDGLIHRCKILFTQHRDLFEQQVRAVYSPRMPTGLSESSTMITLVRRGRIDWLRPYAELAQDAMQIRNPDTPQRTRTPSVFDGWKKTPVHPFVPSSYIKTPWTRFQVDQYDHLETLGRVHCPKVVSYVDPNDGRQLDATERQAKMEAALRAALVPLGGKMPARVFYDWNSLWDHRTSVSRFLPFSNSIQAVDADFNLFDFTRAYDLAHILGDLGAGSPFFAVALATMAGMQSGGATLVANLRRDEGATLLLITPPTAQELKKDADVVRPFWPRFYGFN